MSACFEHGRRFKRKRRKEDRGLAEEIEQIIGVPTKVLTDAELEKHVAGLIEEGKLRKEDF